MAKSQSYGNKRILTGPRGGKYYMSDMGTKVYISSKSSSKSSGSMTRCRKSAKYERCVQHVKRKRRYNPWAVCTVSVCKYKSKEI